MDALADIKLDIQEFDHVQAQLFSLVARDASSKYFLEASIEKEGNIQQELKNPEDQTNLDVFFYLIVSPEQPGGHFKMAVYNDQAVWMSFGLLLVVIALIVCCFGALMYCACCQDNDDDDIQKLSDNPH